MARTVSVLSRNLVSVSGNLGEVRVLQREADEAEVLCHQQPLHDPRQRGALLSRAAQLRAREHDILRPAQVAVQLEHEAGARVRLVGQHLRGMSRTRLSRDTARTQPLGEGP